MLSSPSPAPRAYSRWFFRNHPSTFTHRSVTLDTGSTESQKFMAYPDTRLCVQLTEGKTIYTIITDDLERLSSVASTCRRLRDSACMRSNTTILPFSQLLYLISEEFEQCRISPLVIAIRTPSIFVAIRYVVCHGIPTERS